MQLKEELKEIKIVWVDLAFNKKLKTKLRALAKCLIESLVTFYSCTNRSLTDRTHSAKSDLNREAIF